MLLLNEKQVRSGFKCHELVGTKHENSRYLNVTYQTRDVFTHLGPPIIVTNKTNKYFAYNMMN